MWELNKNWIRVTREKNMNTFILDDAGNKLKKLIIINYYHYHLQ